MKTENNNSSRTKARAFRITYTQDMLLNDPRAKYKSSAIVRVLLQLYFNKRIPNIDALIEAEEKMIEEKVAKNFSKFREMLRTNNPKKKKEVLGNGNNPSSI